MRKYFGKKVPNYVAFHCPVPPIMKNPEKRRNRDQVVATTKNTLLNILVEDMQEQYMATKSEIAALEIQLMELLKADEWQELNDTIGGSQCTGQKIRKNLPQRKKICTAQTPIQEVLPQQKKGEHR